MVWEVYSCKWLCKKETPLFLFNLDFSIEKLKYNTYWHFVLCGKELGYKKHRFNEQFSLYYFVRFKRYPMYLLSSHVIVAAV